LIKIPVMSGVIDRRLLVNYRVDPEALAPMLPPPFRPKLIRGMAVAGICLIRLKSVRPQWLPGWLGLSSENAAHRAAVEWDSDDGVREGVYVRRRDTNSRLNALVGGRLFPGVHSHARFAVNESRGAMEVEMRSDDGQTEIVVRGRRSDQWPASSVFPSLAEASDFFAAGSLGYSDARRGGRYDGLELRCCRWETQPLHVEEVRSSMFDDASLFPRGSVEFDCALLMEGIEHEWHSREALCCENSTESSIK
jgi:hypothetical protein